MAGKHSRKLFEKKDKTLYSAQATKTTSDYTSVSLPIKIILSVVVASLVFSAAWIGVFFALGSANQKLLRESEVVFESLGPKKAIKTLAENNSDIKAWIKVDGTLINSVVCQTDNNEYYINHNQNGKKSRYGSLFLMSGDNIERSNQDQNIVVFGNNMKDGSMFGNLKKYRNLNFYKQHPTIDFYYGNTQEKYIVFSVMLISSSENDSNQNYNPTKSYFSNQTEFNQWKVETVSRSMINTNVEISAEDNFITLVTSADDFDGARLAVMAKQITDWDSYHVDASSAAVNPNIKYPKIWYAERGLEYPYN